MATYVIAGNYNQFAEWCREKRVSTSSPLVVYVGENDGRKLHGLRYPEIVCIGTFRDRRDIEEMEMLVQRATRPEPEIIYVPTPVQAPAVKDMSRESFSHIGGRVVDWS